MNNDILRLDDDPSLERIRSFLDEVAFSYVSHSLLYDHEFSVFPAFDVLHARLARLRPIYRLVFTLFREGHRADEAVLRGALPGDVFEALDRVGLLVRDGLGRWSTPGLVLVPVGGLVLAVSTPPQYPTATTRKVPVYLGTDSLLVTRALPEHLEGRRVLDVCAGSGVQGMLCAARGASRVICLEKSELAVNVARFNVALNRLRHRVEVRQSDLLSALDRDEVFDFVVSNPPFMPVVEGVDYPICGTGGSDGMALTRRIFESLPGRIASGGSGVMFCNALGDHRSVFFNQEVLLPFARHHGFDVRAFVHDKQPLSQYVERFLEPNLRNTCPEIPPEDRQTRIGAWRAGLEGHVPPPDHVYGELIRFWERGGEGKLANLAVYNPAVLDPLAPLARTEAAAC